MKHGMNTIWWIKTTHVSMITNVAININFWYYINYEITCNLLNMFLSFLDFWLDLTWDWSLNWCIFSVGNLTNPDSLFCLPDRFNLLWQSHDARGFLMLRFHTVLCPSLNTHSCKLRCQIYFAFLFNAMKYFIRARTIVSD